MLNGWIGRRKRMQAIGKVFHNGDVVLEGTKA